jgi:hypothetical protein
MSPWLMNGGWEEAPITASHQRYRRSADDHLSVNDLLYLYQSNQTPEKRHIGSALKGLNSKNLQLHSSGYDPNHAAYHQRDAYPQQYKRHLGPAMSNWLNTMTSSARHKRPAERSWLYSPDELSEDDHLVGKRHLSSIARLGSLPFPLTKYSSSFYVGGAWPHSGSSRYGG